jgi:hypothetical protein
VVNKQKTKCSVDFSKNLEATYRGVLENVRNQNKNENGFIQAHTGAGRDTPARVAGIPELLACYRRR